MKIHTCRRRMERGCEIRMIIKGSEKNETDRERVQEDNVISPSESSHR